MRIGIKQPLTPLRDVHLRAADNDIGAGSDCGRPSPGMNAGGGVSDGADARRYTADAAWPAYQRSIRKPIYQAGNHRIDGSGQRRLPPMLSGEFIGIDPRVALTGLLRRWQSGKPARLGPQENCPDRLQTFVLTAGIHRLLQKSLATQLNLGRPTPVARRLQPTSAAGAAYRYGSGLTHSSARPGADRFRPGRRTGYKAFG